MNHSSHKITADITPSRQNAAAKNAEDMYRYNAEYYNCNNNNCIKTGMVVSKLTKPGMYNTLLSMQSGPIHSIALCFVD